MKKPTPRRNRFGFWVDQRGASLAMTVVAIGVISLTMVGVMGGLSTTSHGVRANLDHANAQSLARAQTESIKAETYSPNPTAQPYTRVASSALYDVDVQVSYWVSATSSWQAAVPAEDCGLQKIVVGVRSTDSEAREFITLSTLKRK